MAEDQLERIFLPYQRLDDSAGEGFGLGLAIARRAIELRAAGSGPATASPDCACTCGCRRPPEGEVFRKLMRFTLK